MNNNYTFVILTSLGILSGCDQAIQDIANADQNVTETPSISVICEDLQIINEDQYASCSFDVLNEAPLKVEAELVRGVAVEVYFLTDASWQVWYTRAALGQHTSASMPFYQEFSQAPLVTNFDSGWYRLQAGTYHLVIENTDFGNTLPPYNFVNDPATVKYKVSIQSQ
ncbi:MAG: hypothetical protein Q9O24_12145 [Gammaproteobacteria bacterium]|nr:hypothetical protein [Gammaproteobacteria bacterium]